MILNFFSEGNKTAVEELIKRGVYMNFKSHFGFTPLIAAAKNGESKYDFDFFAYLLSSINRTFVFCLQFRTPGNHSNSSLKWC